MRKTSLLYVTADGLLEPLGFSQVLRVVEGLARKGWRYRILSLEKPNDLNRVEKVASIRHRLAASGVEWHPHAYDWSGSARAAMGNLQTLIREALKATGSGRIDAIHARAYHGAFAAHTAWLGYRTPYLFDTRSYWFDERLEEGRWFTTPIRLGLARGFEHQFFAHAAAVVSLTELQATDVQAGTFGAVPDGKPVVCIPTCADYDDFVRRPADQCTRVPQAIRETLANKLVLGIVGSLNRSYLVDETITLAKKVLALRADTHLLVLTGQVEAYRDKLEQQGLELSRVTVTKAEHEAMPQWLSLIDWGMLLLDPQSPAKRASMPTKLGEFFATGVRPVQFGCNSEVAAWVERAESGLVLQGVDDESLQRAAHEISGSTLSAQRLQHARALTAEHFSLASGIERYDRVLRAAFDEENFSPATTSRTQAEEC